MNKHIIYISMVMEHKAVSEAGEVVFWIFVSTSGTFCWLGCVDIASCALIK